MGAIDQTRRVYRDHHLDSSRWEAFRPRPGDVVVSTSPKSGTTWTQRILLGLVHGPGPLPGSMWELSPWLDEAFLGPIEPLLEQLEAQDHQRVIKAHIGLDALPWFDEVRYVHVSRDARDVFMSLANHWGGYTPLQYELLDNAHPDGGPFPRWDGDLRAAWRRWMTEAVHPWEHDGWPFMSHFTFSETFWPHRHRENVLLVHYSDLLADPGGEIRRLAEFIGADIDDPTLAALVDQTSLSSMKSEGDRLLPKIELGFTGGVDTFLNKGTNGRWRDVLTDDDLALHDDRTAHLDDDLRTWMEQGRLASGIDPARV